MECYECQSYFNTSPPQKKNKNKLLLLNKDSFTGKLSSKPGSTARMSPENLSTNF